MVPVAILLMLTTFKYHLFSSVAMFGERVSWANGHDVDVDVAVRAVFIYR